MEDNYAEIFSDFYAENVEKYGDTEQGLEDAYNDFVTMTENTDLEGEVDAFSEFYSDMLDVYGDTDEGMEEAYADFQEIMSAESGEAEGEDNTYSEIEEDFIEFYSELEDIYGDTEEGMEEAYADFMKAISGEDTEGEDGEDVYMDSKAKKALKITGGAAVGAGVGYGAHKVGQMVDKKSTKKLSDKISVLKVKIAEKKKAGKGTAILEHRLNALTARKATTDTRLNNSKFTRNVNVVAGGIGGAAAASNFSTDEFEGEDRVYSEDELISEFADFYEESQDIYGDDVEMAFDDYADALEAIELEESGVATDEDGEDVYMDKRVKTAGKIAGVAGASAVAGGAVAAFTDKNSKERKDLKAKAKAGSITDAEKVKLAELKKARKNRILKAAGASAVAGGAVAGAASTEKGAKIAKSAGTFVGGKATALKNATADAAKNIKDKLAKDKNKSEEDGNLLGAKDSAYSGKDAGSYVRGLIGLRD